MWVSSNIQLNVCILHSTSLSLSPTFAPLYLHLWLFFICIIFSIPHSHPSSVCFTFELLRWLFYFSFFYSNYIFHRSFYIVCRPSTSSFSFFTSLSIAAACVCVYIFVLIKLKHIIWAQYQHYISPLLPLKCITTCFGYALKGYNALWMSSERAQCPIILRHAANEMILKLKIRWKKKKKRRYIIHTHTHRRNRKCTRFQCTAPGSQCGWCSTKYVAKSQHTENTIIKCYIRWWNKTRKEYNSGNVACSGVIIDPFWMYMMWKQSSLPHRASAWHEAYG